MLKYIVYTYYAYTHAIGSMLLHAEIEYDPNTSLPVNTPPHPPPLHRTQSTETVGFVERGIWPARHPNQSACTTPNVGLVHESDPMQSNHLGCLQADLLGHLDERVGSPHHPRSQKTLGLCIC